MELISSPVTSSQRTSLLFSVAQRFTKALLLKLLSAPEIDSQYIPSNLKLNPSSSVSQKKLVWIWVGCWNFFFPTLQFWKHFLTSLSRASSIPQFPHSVYKNWFVKNCSWFLKLLFIPQTANLNTFPDQTSQVRHNSKVKHSSKQKVQGPFSTTSTDSEFRTYLLTFKECDGR